MSRILKASYVNIENNVIIDNTFSLQQDSVNNNKDNISTENVVNENENTNLTNINEDLYKEIENIKAEAIEEANIEADKIIQKAIEEANIEAENIIKQAMEEMNIKAKDLYDDSFSKGYEEGKIKAEQECISMKEEAQNIVIQAEKEREKTIKNLEPEIINFIIDTTQNILTKSFEFNPSIISLLIKKGLLLIKEIKNLKILVSENQYEYVNENKDNILNIDTDKNNIEIIKDSSLNDTDCIIETEIGTIQCNVDEQLHSIKEALNYILN